MARKKGTSVEDAYELIKDRILSFEILPSDVISDYTLSQELGMSRTPIREAIQRLIGEGLVIQGETRLTASPLTLEDVKEICQVRESLECKAVDLIISRGGLSIEQEKKLDLINNHMRENVESNNHSLNFDYDEMLHATILEFSQNSRLIEYYSKLRLQIARVRWLTLLHPIYMNSVKEHNEIIIALKEKNISKTKRCVETHMRNAETQYENIFESKDINMSLKSMQLLKDSSKLK